MPRDRTVRVAVLGSPVQRAAPQKFPSRNGTVLKRRVVVGVLVLLSLLMTTLYFRDPPNGGMHAVQDAGATVLRPFQVAAERVVRPFRDAYGYFSGLVHAKSEAERLLAENERLRQEATQYRSAWEENKTLREYVDYRAPKGYPADLRSVAAAVITAPFSQYEQQLVISAGSGAGVRVGDPVATPAGLVGRVTEVSEGTAQVTLLTDRSTAVSAEVLEAGAVGLVKSGRSGGDTLVVDLVKKKFVVDRGDRIITAGSRVGELPSIYPRGIPIGEVTFVNQSDTDVHKRIQIEPYVDFDEVDSVIVLVPKERRP